MLLPVLSAMFDLVLAPVCLACDRAIDAGDSARLICRRCRSQLRPLPPPCCQRCGAPLLRTGETRVATCRECAHWPAAVRFARSAFLMHPPADQIVHQLKYGGWRALAGTMAEHLLRVDLPEELREEVTLVVPVPTTAARRRTRGYNQAELLARSFADRSGLQMFTGLQRTRASGTQTALQPLERAANVAGAFQVVSRAPIQGAHLLLIDDVLTTGATSAECASTLVAGGARCVSVLTFARALDARRLLGG